MAQVKSEGAAAPAPFRFTGKLSELTYKLGPEELMPEDQKAKAEAEAAVHS